MNLPSKQAALLRWHPICSISTLLNHTDQDCRDGLSTSQSSGSDEIQLRIDSIDVAKEIGSEGKLQHNLLNQLEMTLIKAQAGVKNSMRKLNKSIVKEGSSHVMHILLFALAALFLCSLPLL